MKLKNGGLLNQPSGEDEALRALIETEASVEAATRGKSMTSLAKPDKNVTVEALKPVEATVASEAAPSAPVRKKLKLKVLGDPVEGQQETELAMAALSASADAVASKAPEVAPAPESAVAEPTVEPLGPTEAQAPVKAVAAADTSFSDLAHAGDQMEQEKDALAELIFDLHLSEASTKAVPPVAAKAGAAAEDKPAKPAKSQKEQDPAAQAAGQQMAAGRTQVSSTLGDLAGQAIATAVASPFMALGSAHRHLVRKFGKDLNATAAKGVAAPVTSSPVEVAAAAARAQTSGLFGPMEEITGWKCEKIEAAAKEVESAAEALRETPEWLYWDDSLMAEATKRGCLPHDVLTQLGKDADLAPLREQMNELWRNNPKAVDRYKKAGDVFVKHVKDVERKFGPSNEEMRTRVSDAMQNVGNGVHDVPGFGKEEGEYGQTLTERVRDLGRILLQFMQNLISKLSAAVQSHAPSPME